MRQNRIISNDLIDEEKDSCVLTQLDRLIVELVLIRTLQQKRVGCHALVVIARLLIGLLR